MILFWSLLSVLLLLVFALIVASDPRTKATSNLDAVSRQVAEGCMALRHSGAQTEAAVRELHAAGERLKGSIRRRNT